MMRRAGCAWMVVLSLSMLGLAARPAAAEWSIGSNLGLSVLMPGEGADNIVLLDVPSGAGLGLFFIGSQPGLRFGFTNDARQEEFHLDGGVTAVAGSGDAFTALQIAGNFQHAFAAYPKNQPYLTIGLGTDLISGGGSTVHALVAGFGIGQRIWTAEGHGSARFELRYDHISEAKESGFTVQPAFNSFEMRFGFDLWPH